VPPRNLERMAEKQLLVDVWELTVRPDDDRIRLLFVSRACELRNGHLASPIRRVLAGND